MLQNALHIWSIRGIPIRIHFTWLLIFGLLSWSLASGHFPRHYPDLPVAAYWLKGIIAALFLFGSILIHELMHAITAQKLRVPIAGITLFALGGVAEMQEEPPSPGAEFKIAIVGPLASVMLAGVFWLLWQVLATADGAVTGAAIAVYLVSLNVLVAIFNMLPAFPLDGGRVLRSIIWALTGNLSTATYWATRVGRVFAFLLILLGALALFAGAGFQGVWMALIGLFLLQGAQAGYLHVLFKEALAGVAVRDIMVRDVVTVPPDLSVSEAIERYFLVYGYGGFPVVERGRVLGVVNLAEITQVPGAERQRLAVREVMTPLTARLTLAPTEDMSVAFQRMTQDGLGRMVVMEHDRMVGLLTKTGLSRFLQTRLALRA